MHMLKIKRSDWTDAEQSRTAIAELGAFVKESFARTVSGSGRPRPSAADTRLTFP